MIKPEDRLRAFQIENNISTKGPLSLVVQFTRMVGGKEFPLNPDDYRTGGQGQVAGLGGGNLKKILKEHGIAQVLASEGGRTSRGSMGLMIKYVDFLNEWNAEELVDFSVVEAFWAEQVREYFRNQPFILTADASKTIGANFDELFEQARKRQSQNPGTQYLGTVLQHLVAAKLSIILPEGSVTVHGASVADASTERNGDFVVNNTIIHCTTAPGTPLTEKCGGNSAAVLAQTRLPEYTPPGQQEILVIRSGCATHTLVIALDVSYSQLTHLHSFDVHNDKMLPPTKKNLELQQQ